jgi:branched-chain amino acid transport system ATP-binding protein
MMTVLETRGLSKRFGGLVALSDVSLAVEQGCVHAIIGPNGAGKTTLLNLLSGTLKPTGGQVFFMGEEITGRSPDRISQLGIGRSFQRTNVFAELSCFENCWIAAQSRLSSSLRFFRPARHYASLRQRTERVLHDCGLAGRKHHTAAALSHGEQRQLEIAMMLATEPQLLLLDEPLAGMGSRESSEVIDLLRRVARMRTIVLIEHDMEAVFAFADRVTVLVNGRVLESNTVAAIRSSEAVRSAYLGTEQEDV